MHIKCKHGKDGKWAFQESYSIYTYGKRCRVRVVAGIVGRGFSRPVILGRGGFVAIGDGGVSARECVEGKRAVYTLMEDGVVPVGIEYVYDRENYEPVEISAQRYVIKDILEKDNRLLLDCDCLGVSNSEISDALDIIDESLNSRERF